nr:unnamed protein product [Naegleria fowleri]
MLLISQNKEDDFDVRTTTTTTTSSRCYSSSPHSSDHSSFGKVPSSHHHGSSKSMMSDASPTSPSPHNSNNNSTHNNKISVLNSKRGLTNYLNYNQHVVEIHLKGCSSADLQSNFEIRKVLLVGACRKMKDLTMNFKKPFSSEASECLHQHVEFATSEAKKLALHAQSLYIGGMNASRMDTSSLNSVVECVRQAETLQEIVSELYVSVCECMFGSTSTKRSSSFGNLSPRSSHERFCFDVERASQALGPMDEALNLEKGITILLLRKTISYRTEHSMNIVSPPTTKCEIQSDREFLLSLGLLPKEFEPVLFKFVSDQRGSSVANMEQMFSNL